MKIHFLSISRSLLVSISLASLGAALVPAVAETLSLKQAVGLALKHSTGALAAEADEQRAFAAYREAHDQYVPQVAIGSGVAKTWGYPLSLENSAPSIVNLTAQSPLINMALHDFVHAARVELQASSIQAKDQRNQVIQDTVLSYAELSKWVRLLVHFVEEEAQARKMETIVDERIREGVDNPLLRNQARLATARAHLRITQAQGAIEVLTRRLSELTGLAAPDISVAPESVPRLPVVQPHDDLASGAIASSPLVQAANSHALAEQLRARAEHRALWPTIDFASQYALLASFNNYENYFRLGSFQQHNATLGVVLRFPFLNLSQRAHAQAADAEAFHARNDVKVVENQVSEETLKLQRSVEQLAVAQQVADLEYQVAQSNLAAVEVRATSGTATVHDSEDARLQTGERYSALEDANFELERTQIALLRATGGLEAWVEGGP
jgi:outer membrane protein TolC